MEITTSYYTGDAGRPLVDISVGDLLRRAAAKHSERDLIVCDSEDRRHTQRFTYSEVLAAAERIAHALRSRFKPDEKIAIWAPNCPEWLLLEYGAALAGLTVVTVNPALRAPELKQVLGDSETQGVFATRSYRGVSLVETLERVRPDLPHLRETYIIEELADFYRDVSEFGALPDVQADQPLMIQFTSGTTGRPKGVVLTHRGCVNNAALIMARLGVESPTRWLCALPLFHVGGSIKNSLGALLTGSTIVVMRQFNAEHAVELVEREKVELCMAVPTMLLGMLEAQEASSRRVDSLQMILSGGANIPPSLVHSVESRWGVSFSAMYGLTEASGTVSITQRGDSIEDRVSTVGPPLAHTEVKICDLSTGEVLPVGETGLIKVRSVSVLKEYYLLPEATREAVGTDGWLTTGDLGLLDKRGYLTITGREKEMIIRGGENIYPAEIENVLHEHPAVDQVAIVGVPDELMGEKLVAFVRLADPELVDEEVLMLFLRERLASFKVPRIWCFVGDLPMTATGKIQKHALVEGYLASL